MKDRLKARMPDASETIIDGTAAILDRYSIEPKVSNLDGHGFLFTDLKGRTARVVEANRRDRLMYISDPKSDIAIISVDGILAGWIPSSKLIDLEDRFEVDKKSLLPLPEIFSFDDTCTHLSEHGGIYEGEFWTCFGCDRKLVFNDK